MIDKFLLSFVCSKAIDIESVNKCNQVLKNTIREWQIYQTIKETEREYRLLAEEKLSKPGFWAVTTIIASSSSQRIILTGHNIVGIDSVNLKIAKDSELSLTWSF